MNKKFMIITSGFDCEYVLKDLCQFLRNSGYQVTEIDFGNFQGNAVEFLEKFRNKNVVYITSAHLNLTLRTAFTASPILLELYPNYLAPLEIIPLLEPKISIYIPHDLIDPYGGGGGPEELRFMDLFDHVLAPSDAKLLRAILPKTTQVHDAGWIKYTEKSNQENNYFDEKIEVLLLLTMLETLWPKYGTEGLVQYFLPLLQENVHIKLPAWKGIEQIETVLREVGKATVIPAHYNATALIKQAQVVVGNGVSSIHAESALLGRPTICLLNKEWLPPAIQKEKLKAFPNIYFHDYSERAPIPESFLKEVSLKTMSPVIQPFQYSLIEKIIETR